MHIQNGIWFLNNEGRLCFAEKLEPATAMTCVKSWPFDVAHRQDAWFIAIEASVLGADPKQIADLVTAWKLTNEEAALFADHLGIRLYESVGRWYASFQRLNPDERFDGGNALEALVALARPAMARTEA